MYTKFRPRIRSRHPSHNILRPVFKNLPLLPFKSIIRLGSSKMLRDTFSNGGNRVELNTVEAIRVSSNKLFMKNKFKIDNITTADWWLIKDGEFVKEINNEEKSSFSLEELPYPIVSKHIYGSRGTGNRLHKSSEELKIWLEGKTTDNYIFEKFYNYNREYRLHVSEYGCFYSCRKMLKSDTPSNKRWYKNDDNSIWVLEENELFDRPINWKEIEEECVKSLKSIGLDFGAVDLRIQSSKNKKGELRDAPKFIIVEINSAPSFGEITSLKYIETLPKLLIKKQEKNE